MVALQHSEPTAGLGLFQRLSWPSHRLTADLRKTSQTGGLAALIEAVAARRDREAFAALFDFYAPRLKAMLMRTGTPSGQADDFAQEAMLSVWRKAVQFDRRRATPSAWIYTIARNLRIDAARRDTRAAAFAVEPTDIFEEPATPDVSLEALERDSRVRIAMKSLSPEQLQIVELSFFHGKSHADIAQELSLPLGTVKSRVRLALKRLRELLVDLS